LQHNVEKHSFALKCVSLILGQLVRNSFSFVKLPKMAAANPTRPNLTQPNLTQPNLTQPNLT